MGAWGGIIMGFFGAMFAAATLGLQYGWHGMALGLPFAVFAAFAVAAIVVIRSPGNGVSRSKHTGRVILWSTIGEGAGLFVAANLAINLGHRELLLPAVALVVGLHFLPMARLIPFRPFYGIGFVLIGAAIVGFATSQTVGGTIAGITAAGALWAASLLALRRDMTAKALNLAERDSFMSKSIDPHL